MAAIQAIQKAPWSLRSYAALISARAFLAALATGGSQSWTRVFWAAVIGIGVSSGSRFFWWFCIVVNGLVLIAAPFVSSNLWRSIPLNLVGLTLLLVPESRRYVFGRDREPSRTSDEYQGEDRA